MTHVQRHIYVARVTKVVDGDTLDLRVDLGFRIAHDIRVRLLGVDTPEVYGVKHGTAEHAAGLVASKVTKEWIEAHGDRVVVRTERGTGKYGRWLAEIYDLEGVSLNEALRAHGYDV